jgi:hypothetical protein
MIGGIPENHWRDNRTYNSVVSRAAIQAEQREWISQTSGFLIQPIPKIKSRGTGRDLISSYWRSKSQLFRTVKSQSEVLNELQHWLAPWTAASEVKLGVAKFAPPACPRQKR